MTDKHYSTHVTQDNLNHNRGGLARWSIHHPIGIVMLALAVIAIGSLLYKTLPVDLLPHIVKPEIRVRILNPGVSAKIMEDKITRTLEEQLAITEDAISVVSTTREGRSAVNLIFQYGKDIDLVLRDASTRLDRAKRFLPSGIEPPIIYKRDPAQLPAMEFVISSHKMDAIALRTWVDDVLSKWFLNLPGVASVEVGGGLVREIHILPDQKRLAGQGISIKDLIDALKKGNIEGAGGRIYIGNREVSSRIDARFQSLEQLKRMPIKVAAGSTIQLQEVAVIRDVHEDEKLRVRLNGVSGIKMTIQKRPNANTIEVVNSVRLRIQKLQKQNILPADINIEAVEDQSIYIRSALNGAKFAAILGALLAMLVVFLFLGNFLRTLIIGSAIPIAVVVTFILMQISGLSLNIMTLGGLAVGIGMLVDNTIVMLENVTRHQRLQTDHQQASINAAIEVNGAIIASTSTNLAAIIPFLFIGGFLGLLFQELIFTISAAIVASMIVALTLVPALGSRVHSQKRSPFRIKFDQGMDFLQNKLARLSETLLNNKSLRLLIFSIFVILLLSAYSFFRAPGKFDLLPNLDSGKVTIRIATDPGTSLEQTDHYVRKVETLAHRLGAVNIFTVSGGFVFGRSSFESHNNAYLIVQIPPHQQRNYSSRTWARNFMRAVGHKKMAGVRVYSYANGIRGLRLGRGNDDISLRIQGNNLDTLRKLGDQLVKKLRQSTGIKNIKHSLEEQRQELTVVIDKIRTAELGLDPDTISKAIRQAINGEIVTDYVEQGRSFKIRLRLPSLEINNVQNLQSLLVARNEKTRAPIYLRQVAKILFLPAPKQIERENQQRIIEINASLRGVSSVGEVAKQIDTIRQQFKLPDGYSLYDAGITDALKKNKSIVFTLVLLAVFLVFVVLAVQYESLLNPLIIILSIPFALIGVAMGLDWTDTSLSLMAWLGVIMLIGIVVNNAIVLIEYIELARRNGQEIQRAIVDAVRLRLRPILMTTLTTVFGLLPLAIGNTEGSEMLQPLAITIVFGLGFSVLVSLILVPIIYQTLHHYHMKKDSKA
ncbi:RND efflux system, inner membrane transporter [hydrothermal vent metagenome]|uniref:RND efflux system, inner membrane transporter n=1 Tax=hydrothermal vent metagenome TaxID=652676 RepID=A0A3B0YAP8_9ZZZZ